jgi:predicted transposase YdaD
MTANTHSTAVKKAINIVGTMNEEDRYKTIAREREETMFNKALAMGAAMRYEREQGAKEATLNIARSLINLSLSPQQIADATGLSINVIRGLFSEK